MSSIREILVLSHTHHDVGYTNSPRIVGPMHRRIVGRVLDLCEESASGPGPEEARFRWTFEVARPVLDFVACATPRDLARLRDLAAADYVSVTGGYLNMTQLPGSHELDTGYELVDRLRAVGLTVRTEQHGDVNGIAWGAVEAMRRRGIDRLVMALNPDHGRPPLTQPSAFHWLPPAPAHGADQVNGADQGVFVWLSTHYGFGESWGFIDADMHLFEPEVERFVAGLEARDDYPFDVAVVHAANDNRWPTATFLHAVRAWNDKHPELPMRTVTVDTALDLLQAQAEAAGPGALPELSGEWADWWSHGHGSTAQELAVHRAARSHALTAGTTLGLAALRGPGDVDHAEVIGYRRGPVRSRTAQEVRADLEAVDEQLLLFGEHTWGAWESFSKPHSQLTRSSWNAKSAMAYTALDLGRDLAVEGLFRLMASGGHATAEAARPEGPSGAGSVSAGSATAGSATVPGPVRDALGRPLPGGSAVPVRAGDPVVVHNPTARTRTAPVTVEVDQLHQRTVVARDVPPFGVVRIEAPQAPRPSGTGERIATERYEAVVDPARGGVVSLVDRRTGRQLVDPAAGHGLAAVVHEDVAPGSTHPFVQGEPVRFRPEDPGPEFVRSAATGRERPAITEAADHVAITWTSHAPTLAVESTLRLYHGLDCIDVSVTVRKDEVLTPESVFIAFPFALADPRFLLETAGAVFTAEHEQLPDTSKDWYSIQHAAAVHGTAPDGAPAGVLWASWDAPLVQLGGFQTGRWARTLDARAGHLNSWIANNLHFTNFRRQQHGVDTYRYRLVPTDAPVDPAAVRLLGDDVLFDLTARQYAGPLPADGAASLVVSRPDDVLVDLRPVAADGCGARDTAGTGDAEGAHGSDGADWTEGVDGSDGAVRVRLRSVRAHPVTVALAWSGPSAVEVAGIGSGLGLEAAGALPRNTARPSGAVLAPDRDPLAVRIEPYGVADVLLRRVGGAGGA